MHPSPPHRTLRVWLLSCAVVAAIPLLGLLLVGSCIYREVARNRNSQVARNLIERVGGKASGIKVSGGQIITRVTLEGTETDDAELKRLARRIPYVEHLCLNGTLVSDEGLNSIQRLSNLERLEIVMTNVTLPAVERLQQKRPDLEVLYSRQQKKGSSWGDGAWQRAVDVGGFVNPNDPGGTSFILAECTVTNVDLQRIFFSTDSGGRVYCLRNAKLSNPKWDKVRGYPGLLNLAGTTISNDVLKGFGPGRSNIRHLVLRGTPVSDKGLRHLNGMPRLIHLDLRDTDVSDAGIVELQRLTSLKLIRLQGTKVTRTGVGKLRRTMAETTIEL